MKLIGLLKRMRRANIQALQIASPLLALFILIACGGGGGGSTTSAPHIPNISNLQYSPTSVPRDSQGIPTPQVSYSFQYSDINGDINSANLDLSFNGGPPTTYPIQISMVGTSGTANGVLSINNGTPGTWGFVFYVTDKSNNKSNQLNGTLTVLDGPYILNFSNQGITAAPGLPNPVYTMSFEAFFYGGGVPPNMYGGDGLVEMLINNSVVHSMVVGSTQTSWPTISYTPGATYRLTVTGKNNQTVSASITP